MADKPRFKLPGKTSRLDLHTRLARQEAFREQTKALYHLMQEFLPTRIQMRRSIDSGDVTLSGLSQDEAEVAIRALIDMHRVGMPR